MNAPDPSARTPYNTPVPGSPPPTPPPGPPQPTRPSPPTHAPAELTSSAPPASKPPVLAIVALVIAGSSLIFGLIAIGVGVSAQARSSQLQQQVDALEAQQAEVVGTLAALDQRTGTTLADYLSALDKRVADVEATANGAFSRADEAASSAGFAQDYAYGVDLRLDTVIECVNRYMKTVGDSGGGYYQYFFC